MKSLVQCDTFLDTLFSLKQLSFPPCTYFCELISGSQIRDAIIVMSINNRTFSRRGSFVLELLKLDVPLNVTTFLGGAFSSVFSLGQLSSIETLAASKVRTFDWNIKKSDVQTFTTIEGKKSLTHIEFLSAENSTKYSSSAKGLRRSFFPSSLIAVSPCRAARSYSKEVFSFSLSLKLNLTLLEGSFSFFWTASTLFSLIFSKKFSRFLSISFFLALSTSWSPLSRFFSCWQLLSRFSYLSLNSLKMAMRAGIVLIQSRSEQFLILQNKEYSQNSDVCSRYRKNLTQSSAKTSFSAISWNCLQKTSKAASYSLSPDVVVSGLSLLFWMQSCRACSMCSIILLKSTLPKFSSMLSSDILQKTTILNLFSPDFRQLYSTLISSNSISGFFPKFLHEYKKQASSMISCTNPQKCSLVLVQFLQVSCMQESRVLMLSLCILVLGMTMFLINVRYSQLLSTRFEQVVSLFVSGSSTSITLKNYKKKTSATEN